MRRLLYLSTALILLTGCLEHRYFLRVGPDDRCRASYRLKGDGPDIQDGRELLPDSASWHLLRSVEESEDQTTHIIEGGIDFNHPADIERGFDWNRKPSDSVYFRPQLILTSRRVPFGSVHKFLGRLKSREFNRFYGDVWEYVPPECRILENKELKEKLSEGDQEILEKKFALGILQWNRNRYERILDETVRVFRLRGELPPDSGSIAISIVRAGWESDIHSYLNNIELGQPETANLNWWSDLRPLFLGRLLDLVGASRIIEAGVIADAFEQQYQITKDLEDDSFIFDICLPGRMMKTNGDRSGDTLHWEASGKDFQNTDIEMVAVSFLPDNGQIGVAVGVVILISMGLMWRNRRLQSDVEKDPNAND